MAAEAPPTFPVDLDAFLDGARAEAKRWEAWRAKLDAEMTGVILPASMTEATATRLPGVRRGR